MVVVWGLNRCHVLARIERCGHCTCYSWCVVTCNLRGGGTEIWSGGWHERLQSSWLFVNNFIQWAVLIIVTQAYLQVPGRELGGLKASPPQFYRPCVTSFPDYHIHSFQYFGLQAMGMSESGNEARPHELTPQRMIVLSENGLFMVLRLQQLAAAMIRSGIITVWCIIRMVWWLWYHLALFQGSSQFFIHQRWEEHRKWANAHPCCP